MLPFFFSLNPIIKDPQPIVCMADVVTRQELHEIIEESKLRMEYEIRVRCAVGDYFIKKYEQKEYK